jgi:hypothetical protein
MMISSIHTFVKKGNILISIATGGSGIAMRNQHNHTLFNTGRAIWLVVRAADNPTAESHHFYNDVGMRRSVHTLKGPAIQVHVVAPWGYNVC